MATKFDELTGFATKELFYENVKNAVLANPLERHCIVYFDIDNFKIFNVVCVSRYSYRGVVAFTFLWRIIKICSKTDFCSHGKLCCIFFGKIHINFVSWKSFFVNVIGLDYKLRWVWRRRWIINYRTDDFNLIVKTIFQVEIKVKIGKWE